jgi:hypothetical protein
MGRLLGANEIAPEIYPNFRVEIQVLPAARQE